MASTYESGRAVAAPWWLYLLLWIGFAGFFALIPATSQLFTYWGDDGSGALPWVWIVPATGSLIALRVFGLDDAYTMFIASGYGTFLVAAGQGQRTRSISD